MNVTFLGLTGPSGVLPLHYTALLIERSRRQPSDLALREFLDIFHHRTLSLFYRAWQKHHFPATYECHASSRGEHLPSGSDGEDDLFTFCLRALVGVGTRALRDRMSIDDQTLLYYAGHLAHFPRSAVALEDLLRDYFATSAEVVQFSGQWLRLAREDRSRLDSANGTRSRNCLLGENLVVGARMWSPQSKFRVRIGPLSWERFQTFLPGGTALRQLTDLVRFYAGDALDFDVQVIVYHEEVPCARLVTDPQRAFRLGRNSWSTAHGLTKNAEDAVFTCR
jgi:type VI secretion system protein ImpH